MTCANGEYVGWAHFRHLLRTTCSMNCIEYCIENVIEGTTIETWPALLLAFERLYPSPFFLRFLVTTLFKKRIRLLLAFLLLLKTFPIFISFYFFKLTT